MNTENPPEGMPKQSEAEIKEKTKEILAYTKDTLTIKKIEDLVAKAENISGLQNFTELLNKAPDPKKVQVNKNANNSKYLPISSVEAKLDQLFFGLWETKNFKWTREVNEMVGSLELSVYHPVIKEWITKNGVGAVPIQQEAKTPIADILAKKYKNALVKDFPHMEAECIKNAAKKFGKVFGRDLNRDFEDVYTPLINMEPPPDMNEDDAKSEISKLKTDEEYVKYYQEMKKLMKVDWFARAMRDQKLIIDNQE